MSSMKRTLKMAEWLFLVALASSCAQAATPGSGTVPPATPAPLAMSTSAASPQGGTPVSTVASVPPAAKPGDQVYVDPAGWYAVNFPAEWKTTSNPNSFAGENGFFETGYLPDMMFMRNALDVCQWLANIDPNSAYSISLGSQPAGCSLITLPEVTPPAVREIIRNPRADTPQRFFYVEADADHFGEIMSTFAWLQPVDPRAEPEFRLVPLRPEELSFWENTAPLPAGFSVAEYKLTQAAQNADPGKEIFLDFIPPEAPPVERNPGSVIFTDTLAEINAKIGPYGYELGRKSQGSLYQLYKNGIPVVDNIYKLPEVYHFSSPAGERIAFIVYALRDATLSPVVDKNAVGYLVQNDTIAKWGEGLEDPMDPGMPPILYKDELLWVQPAAGVHVQVQNNHREALFSFATYFGTRLPVNGFKSWNDHWILEVSDFVIQDGEILNAKFGFEEVFGWRVINDQPFYFFRKGQRVGISYAGQFLPLYYHEVLHGYCCGLALNNPTGNGNEVRFFGKRDGVWYYIIVKILAT